MKHTATLALLLLTIAIKSSITAQDNCKGRCGDKCDFSKTCQCNEHCLKYGDCCPDYSSTCSPSTDNCVGRCGDKWDSSRPCQCNKHCSKHEDCCHDYVSACLDSPTTPTDTENVEAKVTDAELLELGDQLWKADNQRFLPSDIKLNEDSNGRLFYWVNETKLKNPSYRLFINLLDNYNPLNNEPEPELTFHEQLETNNFLEHVISSPVMEILESVFIRTGEIRSHEELFTRLWDLWFDFYGRSSSMSFADSSGFEHVFVGEKKSSKVNGFHSWVQMYLLEKAGNIEYLGANSVAEPALMEIRLTWDGLTKTRASMFIGTSPEFDMALYTLCMLARPGRKCTTSIAGHTVNIQTYDVSHVPGLQVASAFPMV